MSCCENEQISITYVKRLSRCKGRVTFLYVKLVYECSFMLVLTTRHSYKFINTKKCFF